MAVLFYRLFEPVDRTMAVLATVLAVMGATVQIVALLLQAVPLAILKDAQLGGAVGMGQLQADVLVMLRAYNESYSISFVIFSLFDITIGVLIYRSTFLPRWIGVLMVLAGLGWATFLWQPLATASRGIVLPLGGVAELLLMGWLIAKGIDADRCDYAESLS